MRVPRFVPVFFICLAGLAPALAGIPPAGFQETLLAGGIEQITGFEWAPGGDLWIISKTGIVRVLHPGSSQPVTALALNVDISDERGLGGIAIDPDFAINGHVYLYYTPAAPPAHNRVSRFRASGDTLVDETVLLEGPALVKVFHNAGCLQFGPDGLLYIAMGDNGQPALAQRLDTLLGKILRIAPDGSIPQNNPFAGDPNARAEIWAYGLRNPWRFAIQPVTGNLFIGDVGDASWEEIDLGLAGANYGYPLTEGPQPPGVAGVTYPIWSYSHNGGSASVTAGDHMRAGSFPAQYENDFFWADYIFETIYRMKLDAGNQPVGNEIFATAASSPVHLRVGPDGSLYYASFADGAIYRVAWVGGTNQQPVAVATGAPTSGLTPLQVQLDGTGSFDPDSNTLTYLWSFGDEGGSTTATASHVYSAPGVYTATLTVGDGQSSGSDTVRIVAGNRAPVAAILSPAGGSMFDAGDVIGFSGSATDSEDGTLAPSRFTWSVLFHHDTHTHPWLGPIQGVASGSFRAADTGEPDPDVWYEIRLTAADSGAPLGAGGSLSHTRSIGVFPNLGSLGLRSAPHPGLALRLDGHPVAAPLDVAGVVGFKRDVEAVSPQSPGDGHTYVFTGWSDGGAALHTVAIPATPAIVTATYGCDLQTTPTDLELAPAAGGQIRLSWSPPAGPCLATGPARYRIYAGTSRLPSSGAGDFPADPPFAPIGTTTATTLTLTPAPGPQYYIVVGIGSDAAEGPAGHYGR